MFNFLKNLFNVERENGPTANSLFSEDKKFLSKISCKKDCLYKEICSFRNTDWLCQYVKFFPNYDKNKPTFIILDDNEGVISFIEDDLKELEKEGKIDLSKYNIFTFSGQFAAFSAIASIRALGNVKVSGGLLDITIGGISIDNSNTSIIYTGVDVFLEIIKYSINSKLIFFTGNKLNPYIAKNKLLIDKFTTDTGRNIFDYVVYKSNLTKSERREKILSLFEED